MCRHGSVVRVLGRQQVLLVLDNCEHVIGTAAQLCAGLWRLVMMCGCWRPAGSPAGDRGGPVSAGAAGPTRDLDNGGGSEAVALFADRARPATRFMLDGQTGPAVTRLVKRLDGMPLAIELAAARVEALGAAQLLDRLDDRFALLAEGDRLAPSRQRSLAATVEWSYQLLDENERRVFRLLSVFPGPFTLEASEEVAGPSASPAVLHLVDCSLLVPPRPGPDGRSRYGMLETLRAYGSGLLARAGEHDSAAVALARYAMNVADQAAGELQTAKGELTAARWLDAEDAIWAKCWPGPWTAIRDRAAARGCAGSVVVPARAAGGPVVAAVRGGWARSAWERQVVCRRVLAWHDGKVLG